MVNPADHNAEAWLQNWDYTAESTSIRPPPGYEGVCAAAKQVYDNEQASIPKHITRVGVPTETTLSERLAYKIEVMKYQRMGKHRQHLVPGLFPAMVSRMVSRAEVKSNPKAEAAIRK